MTETNDAKRHFFISFTGADRPWARWLARTLTEAGYTYWFQDQDFHGSIPRSIAEAHARSERTILLLSDAYARSGWCRAEWEARFTEDPGGAKDLLIPFRAGPCAVSDPLLARLAFHDLFDKAEPAARELVLGRLRQAVEPGRPRPARRRPLPWHAAAAPFPVPHHNLPRAAGPFVGRADELAGLARPSPPAAGPPSPSRTPSPASAASARPRSPCATPTPTSPTTTWSAGSPPRSPPPSPPPTPPSPPRSASTPPRPTSRP